MQFRTSGWGQDHWGPPGLRSPQTGQFLPGSFPSQEPGAPWFPLPWDSKDPRRGCQLPSSHLHPALRTRPPHCASALFLQGACELVPESLPCTQEGHFPHWPGQCLLLGTWGYGRVLSQLRRLPLPEHAPDEGQQDGMEAKFLICPFFSIVCPRALRILPLQVPRIGPLLTRLPPHPVIPNAGRQWDLRALGMWLGVCNIQHPERGRCVLDGEPGG